MRRVRDVAGTAVDQMLLISDLAAWVRGRAVDLSQWDGLSRHIPFVRTVNRFGFVSVQRFYSYAERGLAHQRVSIWIYDGRLYIEYQQTELAHYRYQYDRHRKRLRGY